MQNMIPNRKEKGFTLIELVMVIVILGILAAFALPRFADLGGDARVATLEGARGSVKSAAAIAHSKWLASGQTTPITMEDGSSVSMTTGGYPTAADGGINKAAQLTEDFHLATPTGTAPNQTVVISARDGDGNAIANCNFTYDESDGSAGTITKSGC